MRGVYYHSVDAKGRLNFPSKFREEMTEGLIISRGLPDPSKDNGEILWVMTEAEWKRRQAVIASLPVAVASQLQNYFSEAFDIEPDGQGRILLPPKLREFAKLSKDVALIGQENRVEIWDAALWNASSNVSGRDMLKLLEGVQF